jgi:hypothetical protein
MKTLIALSVLAFTSTAAHADWADVFQNPDLTVNHQGHVQGVKLPAIDPVGAAFPGNGDLHSGGNVEGGIGSDHNGLTSLEQLVTGNADFEV